MKQKNVCFNTDTVLVYFLGLLLSIGVACRHAYLHQIGETANEHVLRMALFHAVMSGSGSLLIAEVTYQGIFCGDPRRMVLLGLLLAGHLCMSPVLEHLEMTLAIVRTLLWKSPRALAFLAVRASDLGVCVEVLPRWIQFSMAFFSVLTAARESPCEMLHPGHLPTSSDSSFLLSGCHLLLVLPNWQDSLAANSTVTAVGPYIGGALQVAIDLHSILEAAVHRLLEGHAAPLLQELLRAFLPWEIITYVVILTFSRFSSPFFFPFSLDQIVNLSLSLSLSLSFVQHGLVGRDA